MFIQLFDDYIIEQYALRENLVFTAPKHWEAGIFLARGKICKEYQRKASLCT